MNWTSYDKYFMAPPELVPNVAICMMEYREIPFNSKCLSIWIFFKALEIWNNFWNPKFRMRFLLNLWTYYFLWEIVFCSRVYLLIFLILQPSCKMGRWVFMFFLLKGVNAYEWIFKSVKEICLISLFSLFHLIIYSFSKL